MSHLPKENADLETKDFIYSREQFYYMTKKAESFDSAILKVYVVPYSKVYYERDKTKEDTEREKGKSVI